jgi:hypothetical protein
MRSGLFERGPMGLFVAQALTVLLGVTIVILSLALLALVSSARKNQIRTAKVVLTPAPQQLLNTDCSARSLIDLSQAAPSRAPPVSDLRPSMDPLAELPPDDPVRL